MKTRIIYTKFWEDGYIGNLNLSEKLLFLYLLSNSKIGLSGIYECPDRTILFETGLNSSQLESTKQKFSSNNKFHFYEGWIKIQNVDKYNQFTGEKNEIAKERELSMVPDTVLKYFDRVSIEYSRNGNSPNNHNKKSEINKGGVGGNSCSKEYFKSHTEEILLEAKKLYPDKNAEKVLQEFLEGIEIKYTYKNYKLAYFKWVRTSKAKFVPSQKLYKTFVPKEIAPEDRPKLETIEKTRRALINKMKM